MVSGASAPDHAIAYTGPAISSLILTWGLVRDGAHGTAIKLVIEEASRVVGSFANRPTRLHARAFVGDASWVAPDCMHVDGLDGPVGPIGSRLLG